MSALYLWTSEVAPDQPWAMRRYVPVVLPLMLIAAGAALRARPGDDRACLRSSCARWSQQASAMSFCSRSR